MINQASDLFIFPFKFADILNENTDGRYQVTEEHDFKNKNE